jgi:hypothetical protein
MSRPKVPHIVRYTIRLNRAQGERVAALKAKLNARSDNEVFDYLVTVGTNQRDDLEQLVYSSTRLQRFRKSRLRLWRQPGRARRKSTSR